MLTLFNIFNTQKSQNEGGQKHLQENKKSCYPQVQLYFTGYTLLILCAENFMRKIYCCIYTAEKQSGCTDNSIIFRAIAGLAKIQKHFAFLRWDP